MYSNGGWGGDSSEQGLGKKGKGWYLIQVVFWLIILGSKSFSQVLNCAGKQV